MANLKKQLLSISKDYGLQHAKLVQIIYDLQDDNAQLRAKLEALEKEKQICQELSPSLPPPHL